MSSWMVTWRPWRLLIVCWLSVACQSEQQRQNEAAREIEFAGLCEQYPDLNLSRGRKVFERVCISCHQADGGGTPRAIPPLKGHVPSLLRADGGRPYLAEVVIHGLSGELIVFDIHYKNRMPAHGPVLSDADLAATLAYVSCMWGNDALRDKAPFVSAREIAEARGRKKSAAQVLAGRPPLGAAQAAVR